VAKLVSVTVTVLPAIGRSPSVGLLVLPRWENPAGGWIYFEDPPCRPRAGTALSVRRVGRTGSFR
jgi:hypothetical protein